MKLASWLFCWALGLGGAWGILKLAQTAQTDWFGLPKLFVAVVLFVVFFAIGTAIMCSLGKRKPPREPGGHDTPPPPEP